MRVDGVGGGAGADDDMASFAWRGAWRGAVAAGDRPLHTPTVKKIKQRFMGGTFSFFSTISGSKYKKQRFAKRSPHYTPIYKKNNDS